VEAMKMQNIIRSPRAGKISKVCCKVGSSLRADETIIEFAEEDDTIVEVA
jgi:propionyl-CoA carboxylase alpha chain